MMKRLRSSDDLKDWGKRDDEAGLQRSSSSVHRSSYYRSSDGGRKVLSSSTSRYDRLEDERESSKLIRKRSHYDVESYDRRKSHDRHRDGNERGLLRFDQMHRSESFFAPRRDFPKGFRSERDRPKRDSIAASWRRFGSGKNGNDVARNGNEVSRGTRSESKEDGKAKSKDSGSERSRSVEGKKCEDVQVESGGPSSEREEGELEPDPQPDLPSAKPVIEVEAAYKLRSSPKQLDDVLRVENKVLQDKLSLSSVEKANMSKIGSCEKQAEDFVSQNGEGGSRDDNVAKGEDEGDDYVRDCAREISLEKVADSTCDEKLSTLEEQEKSEMVGARCVEEIGGSDQLPSMEKIAPSLKDKGKSVALLPCNGVAETNLEVDNNEMEGPSIRGFQFFSTNPDKNPDKVEQSSHSKPKDDKLALDLSLSLPNVLLPIGSQRQAPASPSHGRSVQSFGSSFRTNSDGFTASMSFSGSQQFSHNPSCSLTHNALDYEKSVGSKPLFQGVDWKALSLEENKSKEGSSYQGMSSKDNVLHQKKATGLEKQLSFSKQFSVAQGYGPYENGSEYSKEKDSGSLRRDQGFGADLAESIVKTTVSEPVHTMARKFNDLNAKHIPSIKEFARDIISNPVKQWQLNSLQKALHKRSDITLDMLLNANRTQLEILVALKTGLQEFLLQKYDTTSSDLAEIFLNMRCRNLNCRSLLPVDECDCKICSKRSDFCRDCMCLVCSKFDMASNTCSWVGCDVCLHWCHADCGLRESYIRNGRSEMQFYCVACDHPSEMFGFVKEVFQNFVKEWTAENLSRELEYVRRIFCASEDVRGKQLCDIAVKMLSRLANRSDLQEVQNHIINFLNESNSERPDNISESRKELPTRNQEVNNGILGSGHGAEWRNTLIHDFNINKNDKYALNMDHHKPVQKEPIFDELESIVRIKQAEAKMFQAHAEEARKESEALRRISATKSERIEEEYSSRITKLRLAEAEEVRKQKVEELQVLERAHMEYLSMKMRMETDIKDLLLKMEATRRNLTT